MTHAFDGGFSAGFLAWLEALFAVLPVAEREKQSCNDRRYSATSHRDSPSLASSRA